MTARPVPSTLVQQMQEHFNTRQFDRADDLFTADFFSHALGTTGFEAGKDAWRQVVALFPDMRLVAEDILVDGDKVAVRSTVEGIAALDGDTRPILIEIFRVDDGRLAEAWEVSAGFPAATGPENLARRVS